ncbi:PmeII family type II restriction endonuclease [Pedobacter jejuensis]|uniref:Restriction endonuclease n=1 Tax=Pedobacter jejuensis TaxID=1268550 RepID=A0A3N0BUJ5_9SPHI|nr:PmeII family type II restriction endonuclease [Pedobacter jejuensis]RNL52781.1 restriction endonuclease [Pedobacter jejuensis]
MTEDQRVELLAKAKEFFKNKIVDSHINGGALRASRLSDYNINPFLYKYLANFLRGNSSSKSIAEALVYPRLLGSSINTSFGMRIQSLIGHLFDGFGSPVPGIDIEFMDALDGRRKYCQLKAGPNTINHHDVETVINHFKGTINLARTNNLNIAPQDMIVGIIYGEKKELSSHYQRLDKSFPVYIGEDFWYHLTGKETFYLDLINVFGEVAIDVDGRDKLEETVNALAIEIEQTLNHKE